jgi:multiple sugar transport system substrate-binding protein
MRRRKIFLLIVIAICFVFNISIAETIKFTYIGDEYTQKLYTEVKKEYEAKYPGRKVELLPIFRKHGSGQVQKMTFMLKNDPSIDAARPTGEIVEMAAGNLIAPLDIAKWNEWNEFYKNLRDSVSYKGKIYGIPMSTETRFIYYNKDIFKKSGIKLPWQPKTWKDIADTARIIKAKDPKVIPIWLRMNRSMFDMIFIKAAGGEFYKNGKYVVTSKGILDAFTFVRNLVKEKLTDNVYSMLNPEANNILEKEYMPKDRVAMIFNGSWITRDWTGKNADMNDKYGMALLPTENGQAPYFVTMSNYSFLSVNSKSQKKEAALDFIKFASNKENSLKVAQYLGDLSPRKDTAAMKEYPEALRVPSEYINYTSFKPEDPDIIIVINELMSTYHQVALGALTPEKAMLQYARNIELSIGEKKTIREKY